jgi:hypothetical protein
MTLAEQFETRDLHSFNPSATYPYMTFTARVRMLDLFNKPYHDQHAEVRMLNYKNYYQNTVQGGRFYWNWPVTSEFAWEAPQTYRLDAARIDGTLKAPLTENEVATLWQGYTGGFGMLAGQRLPASQQRGGQGTGQLSTGLGCSITYDTHYKVSKDRKTVLDWAASYLAGISYTFPPQTFQALFEAQYPGFINRYQNLLNDDLRLANYEGSYSIQFARNIATRAGEEVYNIFTMHPLNFSTPGAGIQGDRENPMIQLNRF